MKITDCFKRFSRVLREIPSFRPKITHSSLIKGTLLFLIVTLASAIRMLPLRWGFYLNEFDPYFHYYVTKYITTHGLSSLFSWHDYAGWYPNGRYIPPVANLGLTLTAATLYEILRFLGVPLLFGSDLNPLDPLATDPLYNLCVIFPIIMAALTCITMYFLGKDLGGESVGLFSALLLALDPSHINRTSLGWFDDETVGILSALLSILFFTRSLDTKRSLRNSIFYAVLSGLSIGYFCTAWGAARYLVAVIALFSFVLLLAGKYSSRLLLSHGVAFTIAFLIAAVNPRTGVKFLLEVSNLSVYGVFFLLCIAEINRRITSTRKKLIYTSIFLGVLAAAYFTFTSMGLMKPIGGKFLLAINPTQRSTSPLFESVAEHKPSTWATFYYNFGVGVLFIPIGIYFATLMATNLSIFVIIYCLTSMYFASSMIRLNILASPSICLLCALALKRVLTPLIEALRESSQTFGRRVKFKPPKREVVGGLLILMFALFALTYVFGTDFIFGPRAQGSRIISRADSPTTIAGASISAKPSSTVHDWIDALTWMRENLPPSPSKPGEPGTVVASWWDYGYWITVIANKTTLADNGTLNSTQIAQIGRAFMSNETEAIEIFRKYNVTHVVVYVTFFNTKYQYVNIGGNIRPNDAYEYGGDNGKWIWMALISKVVPDEETARSYFGNYTLGWNYKDYNRNGRIESTEIFPSERGQNTLLYKLMFYGRDMTLFGYSAIQLEHFEEAYFSQEKGNPKPAPGTSVIPLVCVYKVKY